MEKFTFDGHDLTYSNWGKISIKKSKTVVAMLFLHCELGNLWSVLSLGSWLGRTFLFSMLYCIE